MRRWKNISFGWNKYMSYNVYLRKVPNQMRGTPTLSFMGKWDVSDGMPFSHKTGGMLPLQTPLDASVPLEQASNKVKPLFVVSMC